jgi:drug/metabolite transporter (DMT)-like permease
VSALLGLLVAFAFGSGDFFGGRAAREASTVAVLFVGQVVAVAGAFVVASAVGADVAPADVGYGVAAGVTNGAGLGLLYHGLAHARVSVVAPLTAVVAALVPVTWALARGERPGGVVLAGAACAVVAGALVAREPAVEAYGGAGRVPGVPVALAAGALLGTSLVFFAETSEASGFWPVVAARGATLLAVTVVLAVMAVAAAGVAFPAGTGLRLALAAGALDLAATTLLLVSVRRGLLVVVAPLAALAPAFTVGWARLVFGEPIARVQAIGLGLGLVGLVLVAAG